MKIRPWTDEDVEELRVKYLEGMDDRELGMFFDRSESAIETKRSELRLIAKLYPDRPVRPKRTVGRSYHQQDEMDILTRWNNGEAPESIAHDYHVSPRALAAKVERMMDRAEQLTNQKSKRRCLWCGLWFFSHEPIAVRRKCDTCRQNGSDDCSFLTAY